MYVTADAAQSQLAHCVIAIGCLRDLGGSEASLRKLRHREQIRSLQRVVTLFVTGVERGRLDYDVKFARCEVVGREVQGDWIAGEFSLVLRTRLRELELEGALRLIQCVVCYGRGVRRTSNFHHSRGSCHNKG